MVPGANYLKKDSPMSLDNTMRMGKVPYCEAIGSLMYALVATWPDITFTVLTLSQFLKNLGEAY